MGDLRELARTGQRLAVQSRRGERRPAGRRSRKTRCCSRPATGRRGWPHIGTFSEVAPHHHGALRVPGAHRRQDQDETARRFLDDMDGLPHKVPDNVPEQGDAGAAPGASLTRVPDPFGTHPRHWPAQQCAAARFPRHSVSDHEFASSDGLLHVGKVRRRPLLLMLERGFDAVMAINAAVAARGAPRAIRRSARRFRRAPRGACRCRSWPTTSGLARVSYDDPGDQRACVTLPVTGGRLLQCDAGLGKCAGVALESRL